MKNLLLFCLLLLTSSSFSQHRTIDRSDTSIHVVYDFFSYDHWRMYPATSAVYIPPCVFRIVPPETATIDTLGVVNNDQYQLVKQNDKFGIVSVSDTIIIPIKYDSIIRITGMQPKVFIVQKESKFGLLNDRNEVVIPFDYDGMFLMTNGHYNGLMQSTLRVEKDGKIGLMRMDGSVELSCKYDYIDVSCHQEDCPKKGLQYYVSIDEKYGYINQDESVAVELEYEALNASGFTPLIKAKKNGKVGLMDSLGNFIVQQEYERLYAKYMAGYPNLTAFKKDGKWGFMIGEYSNMKVLLENKFDSVFCDSEFEHHFIVINEDKWGLANRVGKVVIQPQFQEIQAMQDGNFAYKKNEKWGFMDENGLIYCPPRYDEIYNNKKNWCLITSKGGFGFCKTSGDEIVEPIYEAPYWDDYLAWEELLSLGRIVLSKEDKNGNCLMGVIDSSGKTLLPFEYECLDELTYNFGNCLLAVKNGKKVLIDADGNEVDLGDYDEIERRGDWEEYFFPIKGKKIGLVSPKGKLLSEPKYDRIDFLWAWGREGKLASLFFIIEQNSKFGLLDSNGLIVLSPTFDELALNDQDFIELLSDSQVKLYNLKLKQYVPLTALNVLHFNGEVGVFNGVGSQAFFIDSLGNRINSKTYGYIWPFENELGHFETRKAGKIGVCHVDGTELFAPKFSKIKFWDGEFGAGKSANHYCFFDSKGDTLVGYRYQKVKGVFGEYVCVKINERFGVVNKQGETILEPSFDLKLNFEFLNEFGLTIVQENFKEGLVNTEMNLVLPPAYDKIRLVKAYSKTYVIANLNLGIMLYNSDGSVVSKRTFSKWQQKESGDILLFSHAEWFKLNKNGGLDKVE